MAQPTLFSSSTMNCFFLTFKFRTPTEYEIRLNRTLINVKTIRLLSTEVPNSLHSINKFNNHIMVDVKDADTLLSIKPGAIRFFVVQVPSGNYTLTQLASTIEILLNEVIKNESIDGFENLFTVTGDPITGKFEFRINQPAGRTMVFHLVFERRTGEIADAKMMFFMLGFRLETERNADGTEKFTDIVNNLFDFGIDTTSLAILDTGSAATTFKDTRPFRMPNLKPNSYIYLVIENLGTLDDLTENPDIFAKIQLNVVPAGETTYNTFISNPKVFSDQPLDRIDRLKIAWVDQYGDPVDFNIRDHSFTLEFVEYIDKLTINEYSTHRGITDSTSYSEVVKYNSSAR